jgi:hypothetical protein
MEDHKKVIGENNAVGVLRLQGICQEVDEVIEVGANNTKKQLMRMSIPAYTDRWGETKGKAQQWELTALGASVERLDMDEDLIGEKIEVTCYVESYLVEGKEAGKTFFSTNTNIASIKIIP